MTIRLGLIGAGVMGADHARIFAEDVPGVVLHAICDANEERARIVADAVGSTHVVSNPMTVINDKSIDAVLIAAPDHLHAPLSLASIDARKPVLCEKPLSQDVKECLTVIEAETKAGFQFLQMGYMRRFDPAYTAAKTVLDRGDLGKAFLFHCIHRNVSPAYDFRASMAIRNSAPHEFDAARWLLNSDLKSVSVFRPGLGGETAPVIILLETQAGQLVNVEVNISAGYGYDVRGELVGERGTLELRAAAPVEINRDLMQFRQYPNDWRPRFAEAYRRQNVAWIKSLQTGERNIGANAWDGYCSAVIAEAGVRALDSKQAVEINQIAKPQLYG